MPGVKVLIKGLNKVVEFPPNVTGEQIEQIIKKAENLPYMHNVTPNPYKKSQGMFGMDVEPAGQYITPLDEVPSDLSEDFIAGAKQFKKPLVMPYGDPSYASRQNWKRALSAAYGGKKGKALTNAIRKDGYDAILTVDDKGNLAEAVDLYKGKGGVDMAAAGGLLVGGAIGSQEAEASFLGQAAKTAAKDMLGMAQKMENAGIGPDEIWQKTGWGRGADSKWRFEVDDSGMKLKKSLSENLSNKQNLQEYWDHPEVFEAHPDAAYIKFMPTESLPAGSGEYGNNLIKIGEEGYSGTPRASVTAHELQHAIQEREGFAKGGSPEDFQREFALFDVELEALGVKDIIDELGPTATADDIAKAYKEFWGDELDRNVIPYAMTTDRNQIQSNVNKYYKEFGGMPGAIDKNKAYTNLAGEVEARNTQKRLAMTPEERRSTPPWKTEDVPRENQIIRYGGAGAAVGLAGLNADEASAQEAQNLLPNISNQLLSMDQLAKLPSNVRPDVGSIQGPIKGDSDVVAAIQDLGGLLSKFEVPVLGNPVQGLADYMQNFGYNDSEKERLKRAALAVLDFL